MFEKLKQYGKAYVDATKTALDPERLRQEMAASENLKFMMPNATPERLPQLIGLVPGDPVDADRAALDRAAAAAPYLATRHGGPALDIRVDRCFTAGNAPFEPLAAFARTGLDGRSVFGLYPSTELLYPDRFGAATVPWEWCLVHTGGPDIGEVLRAANTPDAPARTGGPLNLTIDQLLRAQRWLDRPRDAPFAFDEEVAAVLLTRAGVDPGDCLGLSRMVSWQANGYGEIAAGTRMVTVDPVGVQVLTAGPPRPPLHTWAPVPFGPDQQLPVRIDLLDWAGFALAEQRPWTMPLQPVTRHPALPARPEELLVRYLEIVGLVPADVYGVALTIREQQCGFLAPSSVGAERGQSASLITVVYRDRDAYAAGRERFERYRADVLRVPVDVERDGMGRLERAAVAGIKWNVKRQMGGQEFDQYLGDEAYDAEMFPYLGGPLPG